MKYGVREICDVVLRAKSAMKVGSKQFYKNEPVLYFDSLTTSSLEGAATTVYAQGGRGNARLLAWEGERTLTFNMTDALISPESFAVLSGADVIDASASAPMYVHTTSRAKVEMEGTGANAHLYVYVPGIAAWNHKGEMLNINTPALTNDTAVQAGKDKYNSGADIFLMKIEANGMSVPMIPYDKGVYYIKDHSGLHGSKTIDAIYTRIECYGDATDANNTVALAEGSTVLVDYYTIESKGKQIEITPDKFGGYFYLEAATLFRDEDTGKDLPAEFVIPRCKVQSNFTFSMAATGDPSTFDFVLDAFPEYSKFDETKKVLAILQVVDDTETSTEDQRHHMSKPETIDAAAGSSDHRDMYGFGDLNYAWTDDKVASTENATHTHPTGD